MQRAALRLVGCNSGAWTEALPSIISRALHVSSCSAKEQPPGDGEGTAPSAPSKARPPAAGQPSAIAQAVHRTLMAQFDVATTSQQQPGSDSPRDDRPGRQPTSRGQEATAAQGEETVELDVVRLVLRAVENCKPQLLAQQVRTGNRVKTTPQMVHPNKQRSLAIRWILDAANKRKEGTPGSRRETMAECLATELLLAAEKQGSARAKRDEMHRLAVENRANVRK